MDTAEIVGGASAVVAYGYFAVLSVILALIDARSHRLPNRLVLPAYPIAAVLLSVSAILGGEASRLLVVAGGALALFLFYLLLRMLRPGAMGGGDVKLAGVVGGYLGFLGWDAVLLGALAGFVLGGVYAVILLTTRRGRAGTAIAFGPFLLAGAWFSVLASALAAARG